MHKKIESYIHQQEKDFIAITTDTPLLTKLATKNYNEDLLTSFTQKKYFFYLFQLNEAGQYNTIFWNTQAVQPTDAIIYNEGSSGFVQLQNGYYVWRKVNVGQGIVLALIPIKWNYVITNEYLKNYFCNRAGYRK